MEIKNEVELLRRTNANIRKNIAEVEKLIRVDKKYEEALKVDLFMRKL